jgi:hypothetical protein
MKNNRKQMKIGLIGILKVFVGVRRQDVSRDG